MLPPFSLLLKGQYTTKSKTHIFFCYLWCYFIHLDWFCAQASSPYGSAVEDAYFSLMFISSPEHEPLFHE